MGSRDPARPLLTMYAGADFPGGGRVELSGATTANWVAKSANLLVDGLGSPARVGLLLPLHWQAVALLLAGVATGATVVVASDAAGLAGCEVAFVAVEHAAAALDEGVEEVLALSCHPMGAPLTLVPALATDYAREVPSYADHWGGAAPAQASIEVAGGPLGVVPWLDVSGVDRVLVAGDLGDRLALAGLLAVLRGGASLILLPSPQGMDLAALAAAERASVALGIEVLGLPTAGGAG